MKNISFLLPARGRPDYLRQSIESVFDLAAEPDDIEVLVRLDDDDPYLISEQALIDSFNRTSNRVHLTTAPRVGYRNMHIMFNELAKKSCGKWLFMWNDDAVMEMSGYDLFLYDAPEFSIQWPRRDITATTDYTVPVTGRPIYEALGHISSNPWCDAWLVNVAAQADVSIIRDDIVFKHFRLNDLTLQEASAASLDWKEFFYEDQVSQRRADVEAIKSASGYKERFSGWQLLSKPITIDYVTQYSNSAKAYIIDK